MIVFNVKSHINHNSITSLPSIEKVHLDDLDLYVVTSSVVATSVFL